MVELTPGEEGRGRPAAVDWLRTGSRENLDLDPFPTPAPEASQVPDRGAPWLVLGALVLGAALIGGIAGGATAAFFSDGESEAAPPSGSTAVMQPGDLVTMFDGSDVDADHPLLNALAEKASGETVTITFARNGRMIETQIRPGRRS